MKKLYIFDFDGTLFDSISDVMNCFNEVLKSYNFPTLTRDEYVSRVGGNIDEITSAILGDKYNSKENIEMVKSAYEKAYSKSQKLHTKPFEDVVEVLKHLQSEGILLAVNSNRKTDSIKYFTDKYFSDIDFVLIEGHNITYPSKPNPQGVFNIINKAGVDLKDAVYIGDSDKDIQTASNAGVDCILVDWGYGHKEDYENEYVLKVISDIKQLLE